MNHGIHTIVSKLSTPKLFLILLLAVLVIALNLSYPSHNQFSILAKSFIRGKANLALELNHEYAGNVFMHDAALYRGQYFWPLGPLPGVLMIPFVVIPRRPATPTPEGVVNLVAVVGIIITLYNIIARWFTDVNDRIVLILAFIAGSPLLYIALIPKSWFVAQSITTLFALLALREYFTKRRFWFIGMLYGLILATRVTAAIGILTYILLLAHEHRTSTRFILKQCIAISVPVIIVGITLGAYNYIRFDSFIEQGYRYQMVASQLTSRMQEGIFSIRHIPENLYYLFIAPPRVTDNNRFYPISADPWGMSLFITSPYLAWLILHPPSGWNGRAMLIVSCSIMLPILLYYGIGFYQFGYRYVLDSFPYLFMCFLLTYRQHTAGLTRPMERLMFVSALLNLYFVFTLL